MKQFITFLSLWWTCMSLFSQERATIDISQYVRDSFTKHGIPEAFITLTDTNGVLIDTMWTNGNRFSSKDKYWYTTIDRKGQAFLVKAEHPDYETTVQRLIMKKAARLDVYVFPDLFMKRNIKTTEMKGTTVTATRVQLTYKGDTLVVDAQAFKIPEGSMLDALVAHVPGAELHEDGTIYMNGRKVDYLTLNGKDFFKGKNRIMLDNLPYYVVNKLKFYEKEMPRSQMMHADTGEKDYVMDVELKQEYSIGYMGNAEAGAGTEERWMARLFGMRFTDNSRIVLFAGANNTNETRPPGGDGWHAQARVLTGEKEVKMAGGSFSVDDKHGRFNENVEASVNWTENKDETRTAKVTFISEGNAHNRSQDISRSKDVSASITNRLLLGKKGLSFETSGEYRRRNGDGISRAAEFEEDPAAYGGCMQILDSLFSTHANPNLKAITVNKVLDQKKHTSSGYGVHQSAAWDKKLPWGDDITLSVKGDYDNEKKEDFSLYMLTYPDATQADNQQDRFMPYIRHGYSYKPSGTYALNMLEFWRIVFEYDYTQQYSHTENSLYRLDHLGTDLEFGMLPSMAEYQNTIDMGNSYKSLYMTKTHNGSFNLQKRHYGENYTLFFSTSFPFKHKTEHVRYWRTGTRNNLQKKNWYIEPFLWLLFNSNKGSVDFQYSNSTQTPYLIQMLDIKDTSNPLAITKGNPNLKESRKHHLKLQVNNKKNTYVYTNIEMNFLENLVANGFTYNPKNGIYTYRPENVKGNWNAKGELFYRTFADKKEYVQLEGRTNFDFVHNVDLARVEGFNSSRMSRVNHYITSQHVKASYKKGLLRVDFGGDFAWNMAKREMDNAGNINAFDFSYGISGQYTFPWKIQLATDLKMYSRRGYEETSMNTNELVWNASVSRSFLKEKLIVKVDAFDILNQLSSTRYVVNGQGRTEIWQLTMPRYAMLRVAYRFNKNPKKR